MPVVTGRRAKRKCDYEHCFYEMTVSRAEWAELLHHSYSLDLNKGSYYDGRLGCINFWCGPENKPSNWPGRIVKKRLKYPRAYVGAVHGRRLPSGRWRLHLDVKAYDRTERENVEFGSPRWEELIRGTREDRAWVLKQFRLLRQHVALMRRGVKIG
jgi:hypothetical protein